MNYKRGELPSWNRRGGPKGRGGSQIQKTSSWLPSSRTMPFLLSGSCKQIGLVQEGTFSTLLPPRRPSRDAPPLLFQEGSCAVPQFIHTYKGAVRHEGTYFRGEADIAAGIARILN